MGLFGEARRELGMIRAADDVRRAYKAGVKHMVSHYAKDGWTAKTVEVLYPFKGYGIEGLESLGRDHNSSFPECPHRLPESSYDLI